VNYRLFAAVALAAAVAVTQARAAAVQTPTQGWYRITFAGNDIPNDWAIVVGKLVDSKLVPLTTVKTTGTEQPCDAVLRALKFDRYKFGCSREIQRLLRRFNPDLKYATEAVYFPDPTYLKLDETTWDAVFDFSRVRDKDRYDRLKTSNTKFFIKEEPRGPRLKVTYRGYYFEIPVTDDLETKKVLASLVRFDQKLDHYQILVEQRGRPATKGSAFGYAVNDWLQHCMVTSDAERASLPPRPAYSSYLGKVYGTPKCARPCQDADCQGCQGDECPAIVLIDSPVKTHRDLAPALDQPVPAPPKPDAWCTSIPFQKPMHGTHMAGIMVSSGERSSEGLAPKAKLRSVDRTLDWIGLRDKIKIYNEDIRPALFVIASSFEIGDLVQLFKNSKDRLSIPPIVIPMQRTGGLWIVAAGQPDNDTGQPSLDMQGEEILVNNWSPMNLGDRENMLVVTACEDCFDKKARIPGWANFGRNFVGVAAPSGTDGQGIVSTATDGQYTMAFGTSQSAAFVAGLAASMHSCYPPLRGDKRKLKLRIEATSRPFTDKTSAERISTGVIDAKVAMLDPSFDWVRADDQDWRPATEAHWCVPNVHLLDPDTKEEYAVEYTKPIRRLVRVASSDGASRFVFFSESAVDATGRSDPDAAWLISKGPALLGGENGNVLSPDTKFLRVKFQGATALQTLTLSKVEDVLPRARLDVQTCN
jgi:Subtilase family